MQRAREEDKYEDRGAIGMPLFAASAARAGKWESSVCAMYREGEKRERDVLWLKTQ
jgi:hypothetical protein